MSSFSRYKYEEPHFWLGIAYPVVLKTCCWKFLLTPCFFFEMLVDIVLFAVVKANLANIEFRFLDSRYFRVVIDGNNPFSHIMVF